LAKRYPESEEGEEEVIHSADCRWEIGEIES
jgi:hypothetical protein